MAREYMRQKEFLTRTDYCELLQHVIEIRIDSTLHRKNVFKREAKYSDTASQGKQAVTELLKRPYLRIETSGEF